MQIWGFFGKEGFLQVLFDFSSEEEFCLYGFSKIVIMLSSVFGFEQKFCWWQGGTKNEKFGMKWPNEDEEGEIILLYVKSIWCLKVINIYIFINKASGDSSSRICLLSYFELLLHDKLA